jgi:predicted pyridoxine 5'-phosphate oxidase superfamily flavin-nucleotide-binding protein
MLNQSIPVFEPGNKEKQGVGMIHMTDEMRDLIDHALANRTPCILATASKSGQPNMSYRGSMMVFDDESLAYWDRSKRLSLQQLEENPKVCVMFRHPEKRIAWRFMGEATLHRDGPVRDQVMARVVQPELDRDPERQGVAIVVRVTTILAATGEVLQQR